MLIGIVECRCVGHHCSTRLGGGIVVGLLVGPVMGSETPTARCSRELQSIGTHREVEGGHVVEGWG
jgi:hypothetical protein